MIRPFTFFAAHWIATFVALAQLAFPISGNAESLRTVAVTGQTAPGFSTHAAFGNFRMAPTLNSAGDTAFRATLTGPDFDSLTDDVIYYEGSGNLMPIVREGNQAPKTSAGTVFDFRNLTAASPSLTPSGQVVFRSDLRGNGVSSSNNQAIWSARSGSIELIARSGSLAPSTNSSGLFAGFDNVISNASGQVAFLGTLAGDSVNFFNNEGIWLGTAESLTPVAMEGEQAAGLPESVNYFGAVGRPAQNGRGEVAFVSSLLGTDTNFTNNQGIWAGSPGRLRLLARKGALVPQLPEGITFDRFVGQPSINAAGTTAFVSLLRGEGVFSGFNSAVWSADSGELQLVARATDEAPGTAPDTYFESFGNPLINESGDIAFGATLYGSDVDNGNDSGIWRQRSGMFEKIAQGDEPAPGTPAGNSFGSFSSVTLNAAGQIAFVATYYGEGRTGGQGIWATDRSGQLRLVARTDAELEIIAGDRRTIYSLSFLGGVSPNDGLPNGFNETGQVAFLASFTDGTAGVFVSNIAMVPEPVAAWLALGGLLPLIRQRARRSTHPTSPDNSFNRQPQAYASPR